MIVIKLREFGQVIGSPSTRKSRNSPVVVEDLSKDSGMPVEEVFVENRIVIGERFGESRESRGRNLFQGCLVRFVPDAAHIQNHPVLGVHVN